MTFLAGCGSSSKTVSANSLSTPTPLPTAPSTPTPTPTPTGGPIAGRSFTASNLALGTGTTGTLKVSVGSVGTSIAAMLNLVISGVSTAPSRKTTTAGSNVIVPMRGMVNASTGGFSVAGIVIQNGTTYTAATTGTLSASATSGGTATLTLNGTNYPVTFAASQALTGNVDTSYLPINTNRNLIYTHTFNDQNGAPDSDTQAGFSFLEGVAPGFGFDIYQGTTVQASINGVTVNRLQSLGSSGKLIGYYYYTADAAKLSNYGTDSVSDNGSQSVALRYNTPFVTPLNLSAGQTYMENVQELNSSNVIIYNDTVSFTFDGFESVTVPTGTYTAAKVTEVLTYTSTQSASDNETDTVTYYLVPNLGVVRYHGSYFFPSDSSTVTEDYVLSSTSGVSAETRSVRPASASGARGLSGTAHRRR